MTIEPGELVDWYDLEKQSTKQDEHGEPVTDTWTNDGGGWCKISALTRRTSELAKGFSASVNATVLMRYCPRVNLDRRLKINGKIYRVDGAIHDPREEFSEVFVVGQQ